MTSSHSKVTNWPHWNLHTAKLLTGPTGIFTQQSYSHPLAFSHSQKKTTCYLPVQMESYRAKLITDIHWHCYTPRTKLLTGPTEIFTKQSYSLAPLESSQCKAPLAPLASSQSKATCWQNWHLHKAKLLTVSTDS